MTETTETYAAIINCTVVDFDIIERNYAIKQNNTIINATLIYNIKCKASKNKISFECTVTITIVVIQNKNYTVNKTTEPQTGNVQPVTKQLFS